MRACEHWCRRAICIDDVRGWRLLRPESLRRSWAPCRMRFLFFAGGSYIGGMEIVTLTLMKELRAQGHECFAIVSGWNDGRYPAKLAEAEIPHVSLKLGRL